MKIKHSDNAGTEQWRLFMDVFAEAAALHVPGNRPRGAAYVTVVPASGEMSQLPEEWEADARHASHVIYHYGTPVAWISILDGKWVVPPDFYSPTTSGVQSRIMARLGGNFRTTPIG